MFEPNAPRSRPYYKILGLAEQGLEDSWVMGIRRDASGIVFGVDFALCPNHPLFAPPLPNDGNSFRRGPIRFRGSSPATWPRRTSTANYYSTGAADFADIDSFYFSGYCLHLEADWREPEVVLLPTVVDDLEKEDAPS